MSAIAVNLNASTPITLNLLATSLGVPTSTILASAVAAPVNSLGAWTYFDFSSSHINVYAGEVLAFQPSPSGSEGIALAYGGTDPYSYGELYTIYPFGGINDWQPFVNQLADQGPIGGVDATFVTYVTDVPEPSTWAMLLIGFAGVGFAAYRRRLVSVNDVCSR